MRDKRRILKLALLFAGGGSSWRSLGAPSIGASVTLASLDIGATGKGTYLFKGTLSALGTGAIQYLLAVDAGSTSNQFWLRQNPSGSAVAISRTLAGAIDATALAAVSAGVQFSVGLAIDGVGGAIASLQGAASVPITGGPTSGLTTLRFGQSAAGTLSMAGAIAAVSVLPGVALPDAELRNAVTLF